MNFLPVTKKDLEKRNWNQCDIIIFTGDAYIDHPSFGASVIGRYLESLGYKVGIIAQPDWNTDDNFLKLGRPKLFASITAGNIDSMLAHYTANKKIRSDDAYTPGNIHGKRPNRATLVYANKVKQLMPGLPVVIGGIEASMRRIAHYDYWSNSIRKSIILDSKADILVYGMAESAIKEIANRIANNIPIDNIAGTVIAKGAKSFNEDDFPDSIILPSFTEIKENKDKLIELTRIVEENLNPYCAKTLIQEHNRQYVIINPPAKPLSCDEIDYIYNLNFARLPHPSYKEKIPAYEMIKDSVTILRGCPGACTFCSLGLHQGKIIQSRSEESIMNEIKQLTKSKYFKGTISDLGGPTANVYKMGCNNKEAKESCKRLSCLYPSICKNFNSSSKKLLYLMKNARSISDIKKVNISSGIRHDLAVNDTTYMTELIKYHIPGLLKIAPEHIDDKVLELMRKPSSASFDKFIDLFYKINSETGKKQLFLPYLITGFPGCNIEQMKKVRQYLKKKNIKVEQVQEFIPLPMTVAATMYYTEKDYFSGLKIYVAKAPKERQAQKDTLFWWKKK